jgi:hypothetical protein
VISDKRMTAEREEKVGNALFKRGVFGLICMQEQKKAAH